MPQRYRNLGQAAKESIPFTLKMKPETPGHLLVARSGHGDSSDYHTRFNHGDAQHIYICRLPKSPEYFYYCQKGRKLAPLKLKCLRGQRAIEWLLPTNEGAKILADWALKSRFYGIWNPRNEPTRRSME